MFSFLSNNTLSRAELSDKGKIKNIHYGDVLIKFSDVIDTNSTTIPFVGSETALKKNTDYLQTGDVIIADTAEDDTVGKAVEILNPDGIPVVSGLHTIPCRPNLSFVSSYLGYYLNSKLFHEQLYPFMQGIKVTSISKANIGKTLISYPELAEQSKISGLLNLVSKRIEKQRQLVEALKSYKRGALSKLFPKNGENTPEYRFRGFTEPWEQRKFEDIFSERREKTKTENEDTLLSCAINGMFLNTELFDHFRGASTIGYLRVKRNDLILSAQNLHLGNANVNMRFEHGIISPAYKVFDIIECDPKFIQAWVKREDTKNFFLTATTEGASQCRKNIEWAALHKQTIPVPPLKEQVTIGLFVGKLDELIQSYQKTLDNCIEIKKGLLEQLFI